MSDSEQLLSHRYTFPDESQSDTGTDTESDITSTSSTDSSQLNTVKAKNPIHASDTDSDIRNSDSDSDRESTCSNLVYEYSLMPLDDSDGETERTEATLGRSRPKRHDSYDDQDRNNNLSSRNSPENSKRNKQNETSTQNFSHNSRSRSVHSSTSSGEEIIDTTLRMVDKKKKFEPTDSVDSVDHSVILEPPAYFSDEKTLSVTPSPEKDSESSGSDKEMEVFSAEQGGKSSESGTEASVDTIDERHLNAIYQVSPHACCKSHTY